MSYNYDQETGILRTYKKKDKDDNVDISNNTWHFACARDFPIQYLYSPKEQVPISILSPREELQTRKLRCAEANWPV